MLYDYKCESCGSVSEHARKSTDRDNCPSCGICGGLTNRVILSAPKLGCAWSLGLRKPDVDFRNMLTAIAKNNPGNNINDRS